MKPYRLINTIELQTLQQHFSQIINDWNEAYCISPLHLNLSLVPKNYNLDEAYLIHDIDQDLGLITGDYLWIMNQALFANSHPSFHETSQELLLQLLSRLFQTNDCGLQYHKSQKPDWFYPGSTCLLATLSCDHDHFTLLMNPEWVYQQLPQVQNIKCPLNSLDEALAEQTVRFNLELEPSNLSVKNLANIQVGDILSTNHSLATPLRLMHGNELCSFAELGQSAQHKSIVLKRSS